MVEKNKIILLDISVILIWLLIGIIVFIKNEVDMVIFVGTWGSLILMTLSKFTLDIKKCKHRRRRK